MHPLILQKVGMAREDLMTTKKLPGISILSYNPCAWIVEIYVPVGPLAGTRALVRVSFPEEFPLLAPIVTGIDPPGLAAVLGDVDVLRNYDERVIRPPNVGWRETYSMRFVLLAVHDALLRMRSSIVAKTPSDERQLVDDRYYHCYANDNGVMIMDPGRELLPSSSAFRYTGDGDVLGIMVYRTLVVAPGRERLSDVGLARQYLLPGSMYDAYKRFHQRYFFVPMYVHPTNGEMCIDALATKISKIVEKELAPGLDDFMTALSVFKVLGLVIRSLVRNACQDPGRQVDAAITALAHVHHLLVGVAAARPSFVDAAQKLVDQFVTINSSSRKAAEAARHHGDASTYVAAALVAGGDWSRVGPCLLRETTSRNAAKRESIQVVACRVLAVNAWILTTLKASATLSTYDATDGRPANDVCLSFHARVSSAYACSRCIDCLGLAGFDDDGFDNPTVVPIDATAAKCCAKT